jgi:predicted DNA binding CopG/RHH family protein
MRQTKEKILRVRVTAHQLQKLKAYAEKHGVTASHIIHEYLRRLPNT